MPTIPVKCQLVQENVCQPHQEKEQKLSTKIRKRQRKCDFVTCDFVTLRRFHISKMQFWLRIERFIGDKNIECNINYFIIIYIYIIITHSRGGAPLHMWRCLMSQSHMSQSHKRAPAPLSNHIVHTRKIIFFRLVSWCLCKRLAMTASLHSFERVKDGLWQPQIPQITLTYVDFSHIRLSLSKSLTFLSFNRKIVKIFYSQIWR